MKRIIEAIKAFFGNKHFEEPSITYHKMDFLAGSEPEELAMTTFPKDQVKINENKAKGIKLHKAFGTVCTSFNVLRNDSSRTYVADVYFTKVDGIVYKGKLDNKQVMQFVDFAGLYEVILQSTDDVEQGDTIKIYQINLTESVVTINFEFDEAHYSKHFEIDDCMQHDLFNKDAIINVALKYYETAE
ncbi:hypothetical protein MA9V2_130 [Chryseobacterium phage MA9V-2]|nr:hypothetical protein MA9V2_130 [Chryseobacterium phage MA9V-2]